MILRHVQRYCRYIVTRHCHSDSEVYILPNTHVLGISLDGSGNPKTSLNSLPSEVQPSMPEVGFETATFPSVVYCDISIATAGMMLEGWGWRLKFSSVEKITWKKEVRICIWKKCVDIIPLFSVYEQADDFYHAANNLLLSLVAYSHIICVCNNNLNYRTKVYIYMNINTLNVFACNREWKNCGKYFPMNATGHVPQFRPRLLDMFGVIRRFSIYIYG